MDPELTRGFQELQAQVKDSRSEIAKIETCQKVTTHDLMLTNQQIDDFCKDGDIENRYFYQPVGRMLVKRQGEKAQEFLLSRQTLYQDRLKQYKELKEACINCVRESEKRLRELVAKKLNKSTDAAANSENEPKPSEPVAAAK